MREPTHEITPDGTYVFEVQLEDGSRAVAAVLPEDIDEVTGPPRAGPLALDEQRRRLEVARLIAEPDLRRQLDAM